MKVHPQLLTAVLGVWKDFVKTDASKDFFNSCNEDLHRHKSLYSESLDVFISEEVYQKLLFEFKQLKIVTYAPIEKLILEHELQEDDKIEVKEEIKEVIPDKNIPVKEQKEVWLNAWKAGLEKSNSSDWAAKWANDCLGSYITRFKNN
jgi:hypothetical protein